MGRGNVFSGSSFRATLYGTLAFLVVLALSGVLALGFIERQLLAEIRSQFTETVDALRLDATEAPASFVARVEGLSAQLARLDRLAALYDAAGRRIAGDRDVPPDFRGWTLRDVAPPDGVGEAREFYLTVAPVGPYRLVLGRDVQFVQHFKLVVLRAFVAVGATMALLLIGIGYWMSRQSQIKLEAMADTLQRVADGETSARLSISEDNDQIDRIARIMNLHLETLSCAIGSIKASAVAIAHDLRRPLSRAYLRLEKAADDPRLPDASRADLEAVQEELARLSAIFETILRIARIDADAVRPLAQVVDLGRLAAELGETYVVVAEESGHTLSVEIDGAADLCVRGDAGMLGQVIANLLQNAVTHCPPGAAIALGVRGAPDHVLLSVADDGPGMAEDERARARDPFFRANAARSTEGAGLGLALVDSVVRRHGARIALRDNAPGLRVSIRFDRVEPAPDAAPGPAPARR